jgi:hypothetical protein
MVSITVANGARETNEQKDRSNQFQGGNCKSLRRWKRGKRRGGSMKRSILFAVALAVVSLASSAAQAGIVVTSDSGSIGGIDLINMGVDPVTHTATIEVTRLPNLQSQLNTVNGSSVAPELVTVNGPVTLFVTPTLPERYSLSLSPPTYTKSIGDPATGLATLAFNLSVGAAPAVLPNFFNASGLVTSVLANSNPIYDFSLFAGGKGTINITITATSFSVGISSFAKFFQTKGATAVGNGSFSQQAPGVPEPATMGMLGIGLSGVLAFRRLFRKRRTVA